MGRNWEDRERGGDVDGRWRHPAARPALSAFSQGVGLSPKAEKELLLCRLPVSGRLQVRGSGLGLFGFRDVESGSLACGV